MGRRRRCRRRIGASPVDRRLALQPAHALLEPLQIDVILRFFAAIGGATALARSAQMAPLNRRSLTELQRAFSKIREIRVLVVGVPGRNKKSRRRRIIISGAAGVGRSTASLRRIGRANRLTIAAFS
jgi:hypothetical protein